MYYWLFVCFLSCISILFFSYSLLILCCIWCYCCRNKFHSLTRLWTVNTTLQLLPEGEIRPAASERLNFLKVFSHFKLRDTGKCLIRDDLIGRCRDILAACSAGVLSPVLQGAVRSGVLQQEEDDLCVTFCSRHVQRRPAVVVDSVHIHPGQEVPADHQRRRDGQKALKSLISVSASASDTSLL